MKTVTIYHNPRCSKSRETLKLIEDKGIRPQVVEYLKTPPSAAELARILEMLGKAPAEVLRRKEAVEAGIDPATLSDQALIQAMVEHPAVIERPIVVAGDKAALGRPPESVLGILCPPVGGIPIPDACLRPNGPKVQPLAQGSNPRGDGRWAGTTI